MRRIKRAKITHLSLVPKGANRLPVIYKEDKATDNIDFDLLVKEASNFEERGELLAVVYAPELRDTQGDIASQSVIRKAMHDSARDGLTIDMRHDGKALAKDDIYVAEQFEIQKGDERFKNFKDRDGKDVDVTGGWGVLLKIDSPDLRKLYRTGQWGGVSMMGNAEMVLEKSDDITDEFLTKLTERLTKQPTGDNDMSLTQAQIEESFTKIIKPLSDRLEKIEKGEKPAGSTETVTPPAADANKLVAPVLKADATSDDLKQHRMEMRRYNILKSIDSNKPETLEKAEKELAKLGKEMKPGNKPGKTPTGKDGEEISKEDLQAQIEELQETLAKQERGSNQAGDESNEDDAAGPGGTHKTYTHLSKEAGDRVSRAKAAVARRNGTDKK